MTIMDAIYRIDELKPNSYSQPEKIKWLSSLDGIIKKEIKDTHEKCTDETCCKDIEFEGYGEYQDLSTPLLVLAPYDDIYLRWLEAQIDYANGEYGKYNNSIAMYNAAYSAYANYYNRTHMPKGNKFKYF
jgi:hypothetical protein